jgi:hypothetical protein
VALRDSDDRVLLLNRINGDWWVGDPALKCVWDQLETGLDLQAAIEAAFESAPARWETIDELRGEIERLVPELVASGMLTRRRPRGRLSSATGADGALSSRRVSVAPGSERASARYEVAAIVALWTAIILRHTQFRFMLRILRAARRLRPQHPTLSNTVELVAVVSRKARHRDVWARRQEISVGAFLMGALLGRAPSWCIGGCLDPLEPRAWVETDGIAIDYRDQGGPYQQMVRI